MFGHVRGLLLPTPILEAFIISRSPSSIVYSTKSLLLSACYCHFKKIAVTEELLILRRRQDLTLNPLGLSRKGFACDRGSTTSTCSSAESYGKDDYLHVQGAFWTNLTCRETYRLMRAESFHEKHIYVHDMPSTETGAFATLFSSRRCSSEENSLSKLDEEPRTCKPKLNNRHGAFPARQKREKTYAEITTPLYLNE